MPDMGIGEALVWALEAIAGYVSEMGVMEWAMVASIAYSAYAMSNLPSAPGYSSDVQGRSRVIRSGVAPHRVVYGRCMVSGPMVGAFSSGTTNEYLSLVIVLAAHECAAIEDVWLGDKISTDDSLRSAPTQAGVYAAFEVGTLTLVLAHPIDRIFSVRYYPTPIFLNSVLLGPDQFTFTGDTVTISSEFSDAYNFLVWYEWSTDNVTISRYLGNPEQEADPFLIANAKDDLGNLVWTSDHILKGRCYIVVTLRYDTYVFAQGIPNIKAVVRGVNNIYDPRTETTGYSDNAILCVRDLLSKPYGNINCVNDDIYDVNFIAKANIADELVDIEVGTAVDYTTTAAGYEIGRSLINLISGTGTMLSGDIVTITIPHCWVRTSDNLVVYVDPATSGYTEYLASAASYVLETGLANGFVILSGNGLIYPIPPIACDVTIATENSEKRFTCNGSFTVEATPLSIVKKILTSCAGRLVWSQGKYSIFPAVYDYPVDRVLTENDLRDSISIVPQPSRRQGFNTVRGTFVSPSQYWQQVDFPVRQDATRFAADGMEISQTLELPYTVTPSAAQRLAKIFLKQNLAGTVVTFPGKLTCFFYKPGDVVRLSIAELGWVEEEFRITDWKMAANGEVDLVMRKEDAAIYE